MSVYHCTSPDGRLILGKFYPHGAVIEFSAEESALAYSLMEAGLIDKGEYRGRSAGDTGESPAQEEDVKKPEKPRRKVTD